MTIAELVVKLQEQPDQNKKVVVWSEDDLWEPFSNVGYFQEAHPDLLIL